MKLYWQELFRAPDNGGGNGGDGGGDDGGGTGAQGGGKDGDKGAGGGGQGTPWFDKYPSIKNDQNILSIASKYTSEEAAIMAGFNAQRMIGYEKVPVPKTDADWENWYNAAGRPKDAGEYKFETPKDLPEGFSYDDKLEAAFKEAAHKSGLNPKQAAGLRDWWVQTMSGAHVEGMKEMQTQRANGEAALKREYGQGYDALVETAKAAMGEFMDKDFVTFLEQSGMGNHPEMVRTFGKIGKLMIGEGKIKTPDAQGGALSNADLDGQIANFRRDHATALGDRTHPENKLRTDELTKLYQKRYPEG